MMEYGDWSDMAVVLCRLDCVSPTQTTAIQIAALKKQFDDTKGTAAKLGTSVGPEWDATAELMLRLVSEGESLCDFVSFDLYSGLFYEVLGLEDGGKRVINASEWARIPSGYRRLISERWYDFLPTERISEVISHFKRATVLVLGRDSGDGLNRMKSVAKELERAGHNPIILKDHADVAQQSLEEKLLVFAGLSAFCVVDDSEPSGHIAEISLLPRSRIVTAILRYKGIGGTFMQADYDIDWPTIVKTWNYDEVTLPSVIADVATWAQQVIELRAKKFKERFKWR